MLAVAAGQAPGSVGVVTPALPPSPTFLGQLPSVVFCRCLTGETNRNLAVGCCPTTGAAMSRAHMPEASTDAGYTSASAGRRKEINLMIICPFCSQAWLQGKNTSLCFGVLVDHKAGWLYPAKRNDCDRRQCGPFLWAHFSLQVAAHGFISVIFSQKAYNELGVSQSYKNRLPPRSSSKQACWKTHRAREVELRVAADLT